MIVGLFFRVLLGSMQLLQQMLGQRPARSRGEFFLELAKASWLIFRRSITTRRSFYFYPQPKYLLMKGIINRLESFQSQRTFPAAN